ncbi:MAG: mandelate racemase [Burkholderiales bacterium]|nr:mandelate racemase [Burkholderiales bacterium]
MSAPAARIERVALYLLRVPLKTPYKLSFGALTHFDTIVAELHDASGRAGLGEATIVTGYTDETIAGAWSLAQALAAKLPGMTPAGIAALVEPRVAADPFATTVVHTAAEMLLGSALLDVATAARVPLLGLVNSMHEPELEAEIEGLLAAGYGTLKVKVGFDASADAARVRRVQKLVAGRARIRLDANQGYDRAAACGFAAALAPEGIELFEQPCDAHDWDAAVAVARVSTVPMMLDESIYGMKDIERAAELTAARYIKLKLMKLGSLAKLEAGLRRIRELGMTPVLGNGVACDLGCWMEACVARAGIDNAGEMNGFLKPVQPLFERPLSIERDAIVLEPGFRPQLDPEALARMSVARADYH